MPYYGDPDALKARNRNIESMYGDRADAARTARTVEDFDLSVRAELEADLRAVFSSWPDPDSTQRNAISVAWVELMTREIQASLGGATKSGNTQQGARAAERYDLIMGRIRSGSLRVPGAVRISSVPAARSGQGARLRYPDPGDPRDVSTLVQRGLRQAPGNR